MNADNIPATALDETVAPGLSPLAAESAAPASSTPAAGAEANRRKSRTFPSRPTVAPEISPQAPSSASEVIDDSLEDDDIKISMTVAIHGRSIRLAKLDVVKTVYGGIRDESRGASSINWLNC